MDPKKHDFVECGIFCHDCDTENVKQSPSYIILTQRKLQANEHDLFISKEICPNIDRIEYKVHTRTPISCQIA